MSKKDRLIHWGAKSGLTRLPDGVEYDGMTGTLDLSRTNVDMIPLGLKGVSIVKMTQSLAYVAPDFQGEIWLRNTNGEYKKMTRREIEYAKDAYIQDRQYVESERFENNQLCVLPIGMHFSYNNSQAQLDLSRTAVSRRPDIYGIKIIMPGRCFGRERFFFEQQNIHTR